MKSILLGFALLIGFSACKKTENWQPEETFSPEGIYQGAYSECGANYCGTKDTTFSITKSGNDYYFDFGFIHESVKIETNGDMRSTQVEWMDSARTTGYFPISGTFKKDSMTVHISSKYLKPDVYKNELKGFKIH